VALARTSVLGANAGSRTMAPPARAIGRPVVSHVAPPPRPVPFEAKQEALAKNPGRPLDTQTETQIRSRVAQMPVAAARPASEPAPAARPGTTTPVTNRPAPAPGVGAPTPATPARVVPRPPQPGTTSQPATPANAERTAPRAPEPGYQRGTAPMNSEHTLPGSNETAHPVNAPPQPQHTVPQPPQNRNTEASPY